MHQSVNGNIKHKTCDKWEGDFAGNKASTAVSAAIFLVCFGCTVYVGLDSSCDEFLKKCSTAPIGLWQGGSFQCEFVAANCLSVWQILQKWSWGGGGRGGGEGGELLAKWFSSEIIKQVTNFHAENIPSAVSWDESDNSLLNAQLHLKSFPRMWLPAWIPKSNTIAARSLLSQKSEKIWTSVASHYWLSSLFHFWEKKTKSKTSNTINSVWAASVSLL